MMSEIKFKGQLKAYMRSVTLLSILWIVLVAALFFIDVKAGLMGIFFFVIYLLLLWVVYNHWRGNFLQQMIDFAVSYGQVQKQVLKDFEVPYILMDADGRILWANSMTLEIFHKENLFKKNISVILPEITKKELPSEQDRMEVEVPYEEAIYRASLAKVYLDDFTEENGLIELPEEKNYLISLYLFDCTETKILMAEREQEKLVCGLIYLDNYDEALASVEDVRRSLLVALVDRRVNKYFSELDAVVRKLEKDKYFVIMRKRSLDLIQKQRFTILEDVKTVNIGNEMAITLSIGIGLNAGTYVQNAEYARQAIELALGRGGDQVVVKNGENIFYFGGKSESVEKNTRVKARVKAHALKEIILTKEKVVVMGHKITDVDALGAAIGIYRAAKTLDKPAYIVVDDPSKSILPLMQGFFNNSEYPHIFVNCREARELVDRNTVVVVVDTNKPSYTECEDLLSQTRTIVVLDHHRQGREVIRNAVLSYIEPYASSACEMVSEILQYFSEEIRIRGIEADCLYAGIMIDTNNFVTRTGVRTFEAAAFLRRCGADVTRVRKMFRDDLQDYRAKAAAIANVEMYEEHYAITVCPNMNLDAPTVVCAQTANDLLNVVGVKASFVLTEFNDTIYLSARAIDEVNVQIIAERLGGGGHLNIAGAQFPHGKMNEVVLLLKQTISKMIDEGSL